MKQTFISLAIVSLFAVLQACSEPQANALNASQAAATETGAFAAVAKGRVDLEGGLIRLAASREGVIQQVTVEEGDEVKKGQVLVVIDDKPAQMNLLVAKRELQQAASAVPVLELRLKSAERELKRQETLLPLEAAPRVDYDAAKDQVALLKAEVDQTKTNIATAQSRMQVAEYEVEQRRVKAPLDGVIVKRLARVGDGVSTTNITPLFQFAPNTPRIVRAQLEERYISLVKPGMTATITSEANESISFPAKVLRMGRVFNQQEASDDPSERVDVRAIEMVLQPLNATADKSLLIGQRVLVKVLRG